MHILSRFPGVQTDGSRRSKKQSLSTLQGLRVDTNFVEFRQLQEAEVFSYLVYSLAKSHFNGWEFVKAWMAVFSVLKYLDRVKKIPRVALNSAET